jgi:hypothetical protein
MVHIGQKIEELVRVKRFPIVEFARKINTTRNNVYNIFSRESIDTELLRKICEILEFDFFQFLSESNKLISGEMVLSLVKDPKSTYKSGGAKSETNLKDMILLLQKENEQLKERLADKEEIIVLMKKEEIPCKK